MKQPISILSKQQGFTLIESLIALLIFSIIVMGSGAAISKMLHAQKDMHVNEIIINMMQSKLQNALTSTTPDNVCSSINLNSFELAKKNYFIGCATESIPVGTTAVKWPVLAVSTDQVTANACAEGTTVSETCYVVGR